jgi:hypothetical protein
MGWAGILKGIGRIHSAYWTYTQDMKFVLYFFPVLGSLLTIAIIHLGVEIFTSEQKASKQNHLS